MAHHITQQDDLFALMRHDATIITPNNRLSLELLHDFGMAESKSVFKKPPCLPFKAFLIESFESFCHNHPYQEHPILLSEQQCIYLWKKIIATQEIPINKGLLQAIHEAWTRCCLWMVDLTHPAFDDTEQTKQFQHWASDFVNQLQSMNAITEAQCFPYLCAQRDAFKINQLVWVCFDEYTPQQKRLQDHLATRGCEVYHYDLEEKNSAFFLYSANDEDDELQQLFAWVKTRLTSGEKRLGVVIPDLEKKSTALHRQLQQHFPDTTINVSLGKPLAQYPLVAHALSLLELDGETLTVHQARLLLHSPFMADSQQEGMERFHALENSMSLTEQTVKQSQFIQELRTLAPKLAKLLTSLSPYPEKLKVKEWILIFHARLKALGFPGEIDLNSITYQCYQRFLTLFENFKQLTLIFPVLDKKEAIYLFKELAESTIFQPKHEQASIQILGLLEASGCRFDSLWITSLTNESLPKKINPSPFIPIALQRELFMPHAHPNKELYLADKMISRFKRASHYGVFSFPQWVDDKPNMPSPYIAEFAKFEPSNQDIPSFHYELEPVIDDNYVPFITKEKQEGGTSLLAHQAKCPFRAFAAHRLHLKSRAQCAVGLTPLDRGQTVHHVMELLWKALKNQQVLLSLPDDVLEQHIDSAIKTALQPLSEQRPHSFPALIKEVESLRLKRLVHACLRWERQRPSFEVFALESSYCIQLSGITFHVRVDRIDVLENGSKWVIDYKSSLPPSLPWNEDRPNEPQLLLYALLDEHINTILFAQLKAGQLLPKGMGENNHPTLGISGLKNDESWENRSGYWLDQLSQLAYEFVTGYCAVRPNHVSVCANCDYQSLCRIKA